MATHIGVTDLYGVTLPANAEAQKVTRNQEVAIVPLPGADGETAKLQMAHHLKKDITVEYIGAPNLDAPASAGNLTPSTSRITKTECTEEPNKNASATVTASAHDSFTDSAGSSAGEGSAEADETTLVIKSVTFSLAESVRRSMEVKDVVVIGGNGAPGWRGTCTKKGSFAVRYKGDPPTGLALGTAGAGLYAFTGGVLCVGKLMDEQTHDDVNGGSYEGEHAPSAS